MFTLDDLKQTRYFQDVIKEAKVEQSRKMILIVIKARFIDDLPPDVVEKLNQIEELSCLDKILKKTATAKNIAEFCSFLEQVLDK